MTCATPVCHMEATMRVEWGHGHAGPFRDWLCTDCAYRLLFFEGPKLLETKT